MKPHILFESNGLVIWHGFPEITQINPYAAELFQTIFIHLKLEIALAIPASNEAGIANAISSSK